MDVLSESLKFGISILSVLNPIGAVPVFLTLTQDYSDQEIKKIAHTCALAIFVTMGLSLVFGTSILKFFGISVASFRVGGGVLLATSAFSMLNAKRAPGKLNNSEIPHISSSELGIVPIAIPLLAGPGSISTAIIYSEKIHHFANWAANFVCLLIISLIIIFILRSARHIGARMGQVGVNVMTRIMGLILMALSVEFIASGLKQIFPFMGKI